MSVLVPALDAGQRRLDRERHEDPLARASRPTGGRSPLARRPANCQLPLRFCQSVRVSCGRGYSGSGLAVETGWSTGWSSGVSSGSRRSPDSPWRSRCPRWPATGPAPEREPSGELHKRGSSRYASAPVAAEAGPWGRRTSPRTNTYTHDPTKSVKSHSSISRTSARIGPHIFQHRQAPTSSNFSQGPIDARLAIERAGAVVLRGDVLAVHLSPAGSRCRRRCGSG